MKPASPKAIKAAKKYGMEFCFLAWKRNREDGDGARTIAFENGMTTRQVDAAIDAWDEIRQAPNAQLTAARL